MGSANSAPLLRTLPTRLSTGQILGLGPTGLLTAIVASMKLGVFNVEGPDRFRADGLQFPE
jgi:hypothetical protein